MKKRALITDLDNTLFDWVYIWYRSFSAMYNKVVVDTGVDESILKADIRAVHQRHGTSEYAFLLEELPCLKPILAGRPATEVFSEAIDAYRDARREAMQLYPGVAKTLHELKSKKCVVVGYTESKAFYTNYRIRKLKLDGLVDILFSPEDHDLPRNLSADQIRKYPSDHYAFKSTKHYSTPKGEIKPNPDILNSIIENLEIPKIQCTYVGDSLHKDIAMAKDAQVDHAWAKYGTAQSRPEYELLRSVTHWTDDDVEYEKKIHERDVRPDAILNESFEEILGIYDF